MTYSNIPNIFFKITNKDENHNEYQYKDGLNITNKPLLANGIDGIDGFIFTTVDNIFSFLDDGCYLREITLLFEDKYFNHIVDKNNKWIANKIILGKRYDLSNIETFKYLIKIGADVDVGKNNALKWASKNGYLDIIKYLVETGADIRADNNQSFGLACKYGHLEVAKYLVAQGSNPNEIYPIIWAS